MGKSVFDGYLTDACKDCDCWHDGTDGSIGCGTHVPIMWCPYFKKMFEEAERETQ